jgi:hypothetical protein
VTQTQPSINVDDVVVPTCLSIVLLCNYLDKYRMTNLLVSQYLFIDDFFSPSFAIFFVLGTGTAFLPVLVPTHQKLLSANYLAFVSLVFCFLLSLHKSSVTVQEAQKVHSQKVS